ncbi:hypothetical protein WR25_26739 [Diploscapter pachys]|uniref:PH domain-containing protein n=1 Tax=Diploscapter pachys TaxID=2018661 RepID=A0A2A2JLF6_9BILA|nr:hypothetical protein WR25_26739 [Diploscapter pachys]
MGDSEVKTSSDIPVFRKVRSLKERWEVSSSAGVSLHPDESNDALQDAARKQQLRASHPLPSVPSSPRSPLSATSPFSFDLPLLVNQTTDSKKSLNAEGEEGKSYRKENGVRKEAHPKEIEEESPRTDPSIEADSVQISSCTDIPQTSDVLEHILDRISSLSLNSPREELLRKFDETPTEETSIAKKNSRLPYSVSFHRKTMRERNKDYLERERESELTLTPTHSLSSLSISTTNSSFLCGQIESNVSRLDAAEYRKQLKEKLKTQEERLAQASKALRYCQEKPEFAGSREEVDAKRACLIASEIYNVLKGEIDALELGKTKIISDPLGKISFHHIIVKLAPGFLSHSDPDEIFYFILLIKCGDIVESSRVITSDEAIRNELAMDFALSNRLHLTNLSADFVCSLDIFVLRAQREKLTHEEKYNLPAGSSKKGSGNVLGMMFGEKTRSLSRSMGKKLLEQREINGEFRLAGRMLIDIRTRPVDKHHVVDAAFPLADLAVVKFKKEPLTHSSITHRGFLSIYQRTATGNPSWMRYWAALTSSELKFWNAPEDEHCKKDAVVVIDLCTVARDGTAREVTDAGCYPHSFTLEMLIPTDHKSKGMDRFKVQLAADTRTDLSVWMEIINQVTYENSLWRINQITSSSRLT